jgi:predicted kinase
MNKLYILCGIPFSGKTTLAKAISNALGHERVDLDAVKIELYGDTMKDGDLQQKDWDAIYKRMYQDIENLLKQGKTVVHDTGNFTAHERGLVHEIASKLGVEAQTIFLDIPKNIAYDRLLKNRNTKNRHDVTDIDFERTVAEMEPPGESEKVLVFYVHDDVASWISEHLT